MKANWKRTLLSLVLCAGFVWPAGAVSTGQPAASQTGTSTAQSKPAAYTVKKMGLLGVKRTVESDNNTVKMLNKTAASLDLLLLPHSKHCKPALLSFQRGNGVW